MTEGQKNRLLGTLQGIDQIRGQIARAAREGQSPAQSGRALTPLPPEAWREMEILLAGIAGHARSVAEQFAGDSLREREAREPVSATLYWLSFLVRRLDEEVIEDLAPGQMSRFGSLTAGEQVALDEARARIRDDLSALRTRIEALRGGVPP